MITMKPTFNLSANIENGFAEGAQYIVTPNAQKAVEKPQLFAPRGQVLLTPCGKI